MCTKEKNQKQLFKSSYLYFIAILLGITNGLADIVLLQKLGQIIANIFTNVFKSLSIPIISLSIIVTLSKFCANNKDRKIWQRTVLYTLSTTIISASISAILYLLINPVNITNVDDTGNLVGQGQDVTYVSYLLKSIPSNLISPFLEQNILGILLISIAIGIAISQISDKEIKRSSAQIFYGLHKVFSIITSWVITILPIGLFGFVSVATNEMNHSDELFSILEYLMVIVLANLVQGIIILPALLIFRSINPFDTMKKMMPALAAAFFTKSSAAVLPITLKRAEEKLKIDSKVSRFVLPLCTSINMNGCAAFIFTTVIYVMQNEGITITLGTMAVWIIIATIAAIGNAGIPMGCFFLSLSLLSSMNVSVILLGIILPFYSIIDMIETALNVWSDSCVAIMVNEDVKEMQDNQTSNSLEGIEI